MSQKVDGHSELKAMIVPAFATTIFGGGWLFIAGFAFKKLIGSTFSIIIAVLTLGLLIATIRFARKARQVAIGSSPFADRRKLFIYIGAVVFEAACFLIGYSILVALHQVAIVLALAAFIVGIHFLGLIPVFQTMRYIPIALVFCLIAIVGVFLPDIVQMETYSLNIRLLVVGLVCGLCLWFSAVRILLQGRRYIQEGRA